MVVNFSNLSKTDGNHNKNPHTFFFKKKKAGKEKTDQNPFELNPLCPWRAFFQKKKVGKEKLFNTF